MEKIGSTVNLSHIVAKEILKSIIKGEFSPQNQLPSEAELTQALGISRTIVREGIAHLIKLGVIEKRQGRRSTISPEIRWNLLDPDLMAVILSFGSNGIKILNDLFNIRVLIEGQAAADAALRRNNKDLLEISGCLSELEKSLNNPDKFIEVDVAFHDAIFIASDNLVISSIINQIRILLKESRTFTRLGQSKLEEVIEDHKKIYNAILKSDSKVARNMMCAHILRVKEMSGH